jgi:hypothetical protein
LTLFRIAVDKTTPKSDGSGVSIPAGVTSMCRQATGRSALFRFIQKVPKSYASTVLLPAYVAEGVIQPFLVAGVSVLFYRLQHDLSPRIEDVERLLEQVNGAAIFVLIHYFGFGARSIELSAVLDKFHPVVVEDCAHAMFTTMPDERSLGKNADIILYSLNKFLPVSDGAILFSRRSDIDLSMDENLLTQLPAEVIKAYQSHLQAGHDLFHANAPIKAKYFLEKLSEFYEDYYAVINEDLSPFRQSVSSRRIENNFQFDELVKKRLRNSHLVYNELKSPVFSLVYSKLPVGVVPWCIPARVPAKQRTEIIDSLFKQGILLSTLMDKWDFIPAERCGDFEFEAEFLDDHVLIPISEFISAASMRRMVKQLNHI